MVVALISYIPHGDINILRRRIRCTTIAGTYIPEYHGSTPAIPGKALKEGYTCREFHPVTGIRATDASKKCSGAYDLPLF